MRRTGRLGRVRGWEGEEDREVGRVRRTGRVGRVRGWGRWLWLGLVPSLSAPVFTASDVSGETGNEASSVSVSGQPCAKHLPLCHNHCPFSAYFSPITSWRKKGTEPVTV